MSFVNDSLIKRKADFFDLIKKLNLEIESKKTKKILNAVSVMKDDRQKEASELKKGVSVPCYISTIKLSISIFDS